MTYDIHERVRKRTRNTVLIGIAIIAAIATVVTAVVLWTSRDSNERQSHRAGQHKPNLPTALPSDTPTVVRSSDIEGINWSEVKTTGVWLPISETAGPKHQDGSLLSGFQRTPFGATLAAIDITALASSFAGSDVFEPTIQQQVTGPDQQKVLEKARSEYSQEIQKAGIKPGDPVGDLGIEVVGFRVEHYDSSYVAVHMLAKARGTNNYADARYEVKWIKGDWRFVAPLNADWETEITSVGSPSGYTIFPPRK